MVCSTADLGQEMGDSHYNTTNLERLQLALFGNVLAPPRRFRIAVRLYTRLKLVDLLPPRVQLFPHVRQFFRESRFGLLDALIEV